MVLLVALSLRISGRRFNSPKVFPCSCAIFSRFVFMVFLAPCIYFEVPGVWFQSRALLPVFDFLSTNVTLPTHDMIAPGSSWGGKVVDHIIEETDVISLNEVLLLLVVPYQ